MTKFKTAIAIAVGSLFAGAAFAQSNYSIEQRDRIEQQRIDRGVQSGQLTGREADRLQGERAQIERMESRARSDGVVTQRERARIDGAQDRLGRDIYRESHDNQVARGSDRGNGNGWGRGNDNGRGNGWGRGNEQRGVEHGARGQGFDQREANRGERNDSHANGWTPHNGTTASTGNGNGSTSHTGATGSTGSSNGWTPRTGTSTGTATHVASAQSQSSRPVMVARQGGTSARHSR